MSKPGSIAVLGAAALALFACTKQQAPTINASMAGVMEPKAEKIWGIVSAAYNDVGDALVASKISDKDWQEVAEASRLMKERAEFLAGTDRPIVAGADEPIMGSQAVGQKGQIGKAWDAVSARTVQARIDAKPDLFRQKAQALVAATDALQRASQTKDAALLYKVASDLDEVCDSCHEPFWGTDEPPPLKAPPVQGWSSAK